MGVWPGDSIVISEVEFMDTVNEVCNTSDH